MAWDTPGGGGVGIAGIAEIARHSPESENQTQLHRGDAEARRTAEVGKGKNPS